MTTSTSPPSQETVRTIIDEWPEEPTEIAEDVTDRYGSPDETAPSQLVWHGTGPWKRTVLYRDGVPHDFPKAHTDYLKQVIDYWVPPERHDDIARFDGSVYPDRTNGELAAKCDREAMNFLAINLAHDIVTGERTVGGARETYARTAVKAENGAEPDRTQGFLFALPEGDQRDPDETIVSEAMKAKVKRTLGIGDES